MDSSHKSKARLGHRSPLSKVIGSSSFLPLFKLRNPKLGEEETHLSPPTPIKTPRSLGERGPVLAFQILLPLCRVGFSQCPFLCVCIHVHVYSVYVYACLYVCAHVCMYMNMCVVHVCACIHMYVFECLCVCTYVFVGMNVHVFAFSKSAFHLLILLLASKIFPWLPLCLRFCCCLLIL